MQHDLYSFYIHSFLGIFILNVMSLKYAKFEVVLHIFPPPKGCSHSCSVMCFRRLILTQILKLADQNAIIFSLMGCVNTNQLILFQYIKLILLSDM